MCGGLCVRECAQVGPKFGGCVAKFAPHQALNNCVRQACHIGGTTIHSYSNIGIGAAPAELVFPALSLSLSSSFSPNKAHNPLPILSVLPTHAAVCSGSKAGSYVRLIDFCITRAG